MPLFLSQFSYTPEALANMINNPEDRGAAIDSHLKQVGGRLISFYFSSGDYHGLTIYEAPAGADALITQFASEAKGFAKAVKTTQIFSAEEGLEVLKRAKELTIYPPGG